MKISLTQRENSSSLMFIRYSHQLVFLVFILYSYWLEHISNLQFKHKKSTTYSMFHIQQSTFSPLVPTRHDCVLFLLSGKNTTYSSFYIPQSKCFTHIPYSHDCVYMGSYFFVCTYLNSPYLFHNLILIGLSGIKGLNAKSSFPHLAN